MNNLNQRAYRTSDMVFSLQPSTRVFSTAANLGTKNDKTTPRLKKVEEKTPLPFSRENKVRLAKEIIVLILSTFKCVYRAASSCPAKARNVMKDFKERYDHFIEPHAYSKIDKVTTVKNSENFEIFGNKMGPIVENNNESYDVQSRNIPKTGATGGGSFYQCSIVDNKHRNKDTKFGKQHNASSGMKTQTTINNLEYLKILEVKLQAKNNNTAFVDGNSERQDRQTNIQDTLVKQKATELRKENTNNVHNLSITQAKLYKSESDSCVTEKKERVLLPKSYFTMIFKRKEDSKTQNTTGNMTDSSKQETYVERQNDIKITIVKPLMINFKETSHDVKTEQGRLSKMHANYLNNRNAEVAINNFSEENPSSMTHRHRVPKPHIKEVKAEQFLERGKAKQGITGRGKEKHDYIFDNVYKTTPNDYIFDNVYKTTPNDYVFGNVYKTTPNNYVFGNVYKKTPNDYVFEKVHTVTTKLQHQKNSDPKYGVYMRPTLTQMCTTKNLNNTNAMVENPPGKGGTLHPTSTMTFTSGDGRAPGTKMIGLTENKDPTLTNSGNKERKPDQRKILLLSPLPEKAAPTSPKDTNAGTSPTNQP